MHEDMVLTMERAVSDSDKHAHRLVLWKILPSKARGLLTKEKIGNAKMYVDAEGVLHAESEDLGVSLTLKGPAEDSRFEFAETCEALPAMNVARLTHGSNFFAGREWQFYLVLEGCTSTLFNTAKAGKRVNAVTSIRTIGFMRDHETKGTKVVIFKENGRMSPIFEFSLAASQNLIARGPNTVALQPIAEKLAPLKPADQMNWTAPALRKSQQVDEVDLLDLEIVHE